MYEYGTWKNKLVLKDNKGFYVQEYNNKTDEFYKKYLKGWKQKQETARLYKGKWKIIEKARHIWDKPIRHRDSKGYYVYTSKMTKKYLKNRKNITYEKIKGRWHVVQGVKGKVI
jgi:hypothetical protein